MSDAATATWSRSSRRSTWVRSIQMQYDLDHTALQRPRRLEARVVEDSQHRGIAGEDFRDELLDTDLRRVLGEPLEQAGTDPSAVELIGDREHNFGAFRIAERT